MRRDFLASFCFVQERSVEKELDAILSFARRAAERFYYCEVLYIVDRAALPTVEAAGAILSEIRNLRILIAGGSSGFYRQRATVAEEAIGEVVTISTAAEIADVDCFEVAERAFEQQTIFLARRRGLHGRLSSPFYFVMRLLSDYRVSAADMKTIAVPRERLAQILMRATSPLDLRFEPKLSFDTYERYSASAPRIKRGEMRLRERYELALELIAASVANYLRAYAVVALLVFLSASVYGMYALVLQLAGAELEPGWFSTAIVQAGSVAFIAGGIGLLCLGAAEIYVRLSAESRSQIDGEFANTSFFAVHQEVNVETSDRESTADAEETAT